MGVLRELETVMLFKGAFGGDQAKKSPALRALLVAAKVPIGERPLLAESRHSD